MNQIFMQQNIFITTLNNISINSIESSIYIANKFIMKFIYSNSISLEFLFTKLIKIYRIN